MTIPLFLFSLDIVMFSDVKETDFSVVREEHLRSEVRLRVDVMEL